jgi:hypothetical protein
MGVLFKKAEAQLTATAAVIYTAPTAVKSVIIEAITATNFTAVNQTHTVHLVGAGGSAIDANIYIDAKAVQADDQITDSEIIGQVLESGQTIEAFASLATSINFRVSVREIS